MRVFYFGPWGEPGHYIWTPKGPRVWDKVGPWSGSDLDASSYKLDYRDRAIPTGRGFCPADAAEPQGVWALTRGHDAAGATWTAIGCWDRTCDPRGQSKAVFVAEGEHDEAAMQALAARHFPAVWARILGGAS